MKRPLADLASVGILGCALLLTGIAVRREFFSAPRPQDDGPRRVASGPALTRVGRVLGSDSADATVVVFADFQCPYCAKARVVVDSLLREVPPRFNVRYRHLPLETLHPHAWTAALASECAGDQGRFREYHDVLYTLQDSIGKLSWTDFAARAGVPRVREFDLCLVAERHTNAIERDVALARSLAIRGTPAFVVEGELFEGVPSSAWLGRRIAKMGKTR